MIFKKTLFFVISCFLFQMGLQAQPDRWQQAIKYKMDVALDVKTNIIKGKQIITYTNNSPDTLKRIFIHMFWNAFQPNSMMDISSRNAEQIIIGRRRNGDPVTDFDRRFKKRIVEMNIDEQGFCKISKFMFNGRSQKCNLHETILEVVLDKAVLPRTTVNFNTEFECQVPKLSRRSGRDNAENVRYSLGQWYPKISEYDYEGWHADDYISREFYGVWGDYDVNITLDKDYKIGASGVLQNAAAIGWGYDKEGSDLKAISGNERTWKFSAKRVHDFVWAADPDYKHITRKTANGPLLHFIYKNDPAIEAEWQATADTCVMIYPYISKTFGVYPYPVYSFLQGGGGGTEYPMATLIKNGSFPTALHEWCHSWYQMMLGSNENLYAWMDEGFTDYAEARVFAWLHKKNFFEGAEEYQSYFDLVKSDFDEPMSTHSNFYYSNYACNTNAYYKGAVYLRQLGYLVGEANINSILLEYYNKWRYKHPNPNDFIRIAQSVSGMELQWYNQYMLNTIKTINYSIDSLWEENGVSKLRIKRIGQMPMPVDLQLTFKDGSTEMHYVPLSLTFGNKPNEDPAQKRIVHEEWKWTHSYYVVDFDHKLIDLKKVEIDPTKRMADIERKNNVLDLNW